MSFESVLVYKNGMVANQGSEFRLEAQIMRAQPKNLLFATVCEVKLVRGIGLEIYRFN